MVWIPQPIIGIAAKLLGPFLGVGPIIQKELRVASRRRRYYVLRFVCIGLLAVVVGLLWAGEVQGRTAGTVLQKGQLAGIGRVIVSSVAVFLFVAAQLVAVVLCSTAISDEIDRKTLGILMTTPLTGWQIVVGKLTSKLYQVVLLLAVALPLLAVVRVFGGVAWGYLLSSFCITLTAALFAAALSLYRSVKSRRSYIVVVRTVLALWMLYGALPVMLWALFGGVVYSPSGTFRAWLTNMGLSTAYLETVVWWFCVHFNPAVAFFANSMALGGGPGPFAAGLFDWRLHCGVMLVMTLVLISWSAAVVRKVGLRQAVGLLKPNKAKRSKRRRSATSVGEVQRRSRPVWAGSGSLAVAWRELRAPMIRGSRRRNYIVGLPVAIGAMLYSYYSCARARCLGEEFTQSGFVMLFVGAAVLLQTVLASSSITTEKELRTWPILLATPLTDWQILWGKAQAVLRRCAAIWLFVVGHVLFFVVVGYLHPAVVPHLLLVGGWLVVLSISCGLYFSTRFRHTTSAVISSFALGAGLWIVMPFVMMALWQGEELRVLGRLCLSANPVVQIAVVVSGACTASHGLDRWSGVFGYPWPYGQLGLGGTTGLLALWAGVYGLMGLLLLWRARRQLRMGVFA